MNLEAEPTQPWAPIAPESPAWSAGSFTASHFTQDDTSDETSEAPITLKPAHHRRVSSSSAMASSRGKMAAAPAPDESTAESQDMAGGAEDTQFRRFLLWLVLGRQDRLKGRGQPGRASQRPVKNYQKVTSNTKFLFGGRMVSSTGKPLNVTILSVILVSGGLFFGFM